jgi:hypothetical protein
MKKINKTTVGDPRSRQPLGLVTVMQTACRAIYGVDFKSHHISPGESFLFNSKLS